MASRSRAIPHPSALHEQCHSRRKHGLTSPHPSFYALLLVCVLPPACTTQFDVTNPPRSATEQLLLSTAADRAIQKISFAEFRDKRVYFDTTYFDAYDSKYVIAAVRDALSTAGARLETQSSQSEITVEIRSGAYSTDMNDSLLGIPKSGVPIPLAGAVNIPEVALYKATRQNSLAKFALLAYSTQSRTNFYSSGPRIGEAYNHYFKLLGLFRWTRTDLPEKIKK